MAEIVVKAEPREPGSSNVARRMRGDGKLPAVVYGGDGGASPIAVDPKEIIKILKSESGRNTVFQLEVGGSKSSDSVMIYDLQVDPIRHTLVHADFKRIAMDKPIDVEVPIRVVGEAKGVKIDGGVLDHSLREVTVHCLPADIPDGLEVDVSELEIGDSINVGDLRMPPRVELITDPERTIASVVPPVSEEDLETVVAEPLEGELEPELVGEEEEEAAEEPAAEEPEKEEASESG